MSIAFVNLVKEAAVTLAPTVDGLLLIPDAKKAAGVLRIIEKLIHERMNYLPLAAARILELIQQPMFQSGV